MTDGVPVRLEDRLFATIDSNSGRAQLPGFARACMRLGRALISVPPNGHGDVVILVVPSRAYVAWFVTLGALTQKLIEDSDKVRAGPIESGSLVRAVLGSDIYTGRYVERRNECVLGETREYHIIQVKEMGMVKLPVGQAEVVVVAPRGGPAKLGGLKPSHVSSELEFAASCFGLRTPVAFESETNQVVTVVGTVSTLRDELRSATLQVEAESGWLSGTLRDLLRVQGTHSTGGYRVDLHAALSDSVPRSDAPLVVVDGALALVRQGLEFPGKNVVVLLDPSEPSIDLAMGEVNQVAPFSAIDEEIPELLDEGFSRIERAWLKR